jgi:DNA polymerase-1
MRARATLRLRAKRRRRCRGITRPWVDEAALARWIEAIESAELVVFDTETTSVDPMQARIVGLSFAIEPGRACYIPLAHRYPGAPDQLPLDATLARFAPWFANRAKRKAGQNVKYDQHALANHGITLEGVVHDTLLQSYVLEAHRPHDFDNLAWRHLNVKTITYAEIAGKGAKQIDFDQVDIEGATRYSAEDADVTLQLHRYLYPRVAADPRLDRVYSAIEMPVREVLFEMERAGVMLDAALLSAQSRELGEKVLALEREAFELAGHPFNLGSPKQLGEILFERMKLPSSRKTATGQPSTDEDVLTELAANYPLPKRILEHRALSKLKSTYTDKLPLMVNPRTGRVHTTYSQATAVTGRLASTDPNLQNIPVRTLEGRRIREAFIAPPGHVIVSADYSQIELRIMAHLSGDLALMKAFQDGADIHRATAAEIFSVTPDDVTTDQRRYIKAVNFGLIYGMSAVRARAAARHRARRAGAVHRAIFPALPGRCRLHADDARVRARARLRRDRCSGGGLWLSDIRAGRRTSAAPQPSAPRSTRRCRARRRTWSRLAMIAVHNRLRRDGLAAKLLLQVHDELVLEVPERELDRVKAVLAEEMSSVAELSVPLVVDVGAGPNWRKAH